eukprot:67748-Rhodomonas_salina.1
MVLSFTPVGGKDNINNINNNCHGVGGTGGAAAEPARPLEYSVLALSSTRSTGVNTTVLTPIPVASTCISRSNYGTTRSTSSQTSNRGPLLSPARASPSGPAIKISRQSKLPVHPARLADAA